MKKTDFSKAVTSYLAEYLPQTCGFSNNTINSYRDAFKLLLLFLQEEKGIEAHKIELKMIVHSVAANGRWCGDQRPPCGLKTAG